MNRLRWLLVLVVALARDPVPATASDAGRPGAHRLLGQAMGWGVPVARRPGGRVSRRRWPARSTRSGPMVPSCARSSSRGQRCQRPGLQPRRPLALLPVQPRRNLRDLPVPDRRLGAPDGRLAAIGRAILEERLRSLRRAGRAARLHGPRRSGRPRRHRGPRRITAPRDCSRRPATSTWPR